MRGIVVAPQPFAAHVGAEALRSGGNAFDAAVATALAQSVIEPHMCGVGGWGTSLLWPSAQSAPISHDFYGRAPKKAHRDVYEPHLQSISPIGGAFILEGNINEVGYLSVTVPGYVKGLYAMHKAYGSLPWQDLILPAAEAAERGMPVAEETYRPWVKEPIPGYVQGHDKLVHTDESRRIFTKDGELYQPGELLVLRDYAATLREIAATGVTSLYHGEIAQTIASDFARNGGLVSMEDLADFPVTHPEPIHTTYRGYDVFTNQPPGGGLQVAEILNILEHFDLGRFSSSDPQHVHLLIQAMWLAFEDRRRHHGDPEFGHIPVEHLASKGYAAELAARIDPTSQTQSFERQVLSSVSVGQGSTTHLSVMDADGNAASITHTLGGASGVVTPGLGFTYNNSMHLFDPRPGSPNSLEPWKRRITGMAPTIVSKDGKPSLVLGAPGGTRIITAIVHTIVNIIDHGMSPIEAVYAPRFHAENGRVYMEPRLYYAVLATLSQMGYEQIDMLSASFEGMLGRATVALVDEHSCFVGGSDPRGGAGLEESRS